jgi:hypothetical protein
MGDPGIGTGSLVWEMVDRLVVEDVLRDIAGRRGSSEAREGMRMLADVRCISIVEFSLSCGERSRES